MECFVQSSSSSSIRPRFSWTVILRGIGAGERRPAGLEIIAGECFNKQLMMLLDLVINLRFTLVLLVSHVGRGCKD